MIFLYYLSVSLFCWLKVLSKNNAHCQRNNVNNKNIAINKNIDVYIIITTVTLVNV